MSTKSHTSDYQGSDIISPRFLCFPFILLLIFQIKTTNIKYAYTFTPHQTDLQIKRMNMYPPKLARLGYILERKSTVQILRKTEENLFTAINPNEYFPNRIPYIFSPLVCFGLYQVVYQKEKYRHLLVTFFISIVTLAVIGPYAKYGPVIILVYLWLFVLIALSNIYKKLLNTKKHA